MKGVYKEIVQLLLFNMVIPQFHTLLPGWLKCRDGWLKEVFVLHVIVSWTKQKRKRKRTSCVIERNAFQLTCISVSHPKADEKRTFDTETNVTNVHSDRHPGSLLEMHAS